MRSLWILWTAMAALLLAPPPVSAEQDPNKKFEVYPVGLADYELMLDAAKQMASPDGKVIGDATGRRIIVVDKPEVHEQMRNLLKALQVPQRNVRIKVRFDEQGSGSRLQLGAGGTVKSGDVTVTTTGDPEPGIHINAVDQTTRMSSMVEQELLVINNGTASLDVSTEIPYYDWIFKYGVAEGYWLPSTKWRSVGSKLKIKPTIQGQVIRIKLTPELSGLVNGNPEVISMEKLSTEVIAANGQQISLGGLPSEVHEFYSRFLVGVDASGNTRSLNILMTPTIEEPFIAPK